MTACIHHIISSYTLIFNIYSLEINWPKVCGLGKPMPVALPKRVFPQQQQFISGEYCHIYLFVIFHFDRYASLTECIVYFCFLFFCCWWWWWKYRSTDSWWIREQNLQILYLSDAMPIYKTCHHIFYFYISPLQKEINSNNAQKYWSMLSIISSARKVVVI